MNKRPIYYAAAIVVLALAITGAVVLTPKTSQPGQDTGATKGAGTGETSSIVSTSTPATIAESGNKIKKTLQTIGQTSGHSTATPSGTPPSRPDGVKSDEQLKPREDNHKGMSLEEAMRVFGLSGYRFQFVACHGGPGYLTMKQGKEFMLDNRDASAHAFGVSSRTYQIGAYDFAIATATDLGTYFITCDGGGAAQMYVQP